MKNFKMQFNNLHHFSKVIIKWGTILATILLILAFFSPIYGIKMCEISVYLFAESIISALLMDVIDKRINFQK